MENAPRGNVDFGRPLAFIPFRQDDAADRVFRAVSRRLVAQGHRVEGLVQHAQKDEGQCCGAVDLQDIATGKSWQIMQALGPNARGCRLDFNVFSEVAVFAEGRLRTRPDLVLLNRFGKAEAGAAVSDLCSRPRSWRAWRC